MINSLPGPFAAVVFGASGGLGLAFVEALAADANVSAILACSRAGAGSPHPKVTACAVDVTEESGIAAAALIGMPDPVRLVIVATGLLHDGPAFQPEKSMRQLDPERLARAFAVNTIGPALVAKHFLPLLPRTGKAVFAVLSARVGSISDNRRGGWYGYRASKAALNMVLANLAIENAVKRPETCIVGLHPGTVATGLSQPFSGGVSGEKLFTPAASAAHLLDVIDGLHPAESGGVFAWDGQRVPA